MNEISKNIKSIIGFDKIKGSTILISGGTGFIGSFLINAIKYLNKTHNYNIHIISLSRNGGISDETVEYIKTDITQEIDIDSDIDYILHLASNTHPKQYAEDPVGTITTNLIGCNNLLKLATKKNIKRFFLASSVEIYGQGPDYEMSEGYCGYIDCNNARSGYNESKRTCEALCQSYRKQFGIDCVIARFARIIGPDRKKDTKAISQFMDKALNNEDIVLNSNGNQRYSFIYIDDAITGLLKVLVDGKSGEAYNVSADDEGMTLGDYAKYIAGLADKKVIYDIKENESVSKATYALLNCDKLKRLGWEPTYNIKEALKKTYIIKQNEKLIV